VRPADRGQQAYPVFGRVKDSDGADLDVSMYSDSNRRLLEFELVKYESTPICGPLWGTLRLFDLSLRSP
jgi:hypothetical protein